MKVSMIGLGKLGLPSARVMSRLYQVSGYDPHVITDEFPCKSDIADCISNSRFIFIAVPTPHHPSYGGDLPTSYLEPKDFDYTIVKEVLTEIAKYKTDNQQVVLISTVLPGTVRREFACIVPDIIYNPYLIAVGTVERDFCNPEMIMIGHNHNPNVSDLQDFYNSLLSQPARYEIGSWEDAEAMKIFYNTFISTKISFANMIMDVAERIGHIDVDLVTGALSRSTKRIMSKMYMQPGLGDGGACHPRDNIALKWLSQQLELGYDLFGAIMDIREQQAKNVAKRLVSYGFPVVILGQGYKVDLPNTDGSYSLLIGHYVRELGGELHYHDKLTGVTANVNEPVVYLVSYWHKWLKDFKYYPGSVIVDPWRTGIQITNCTVVNLGEAI